MRLFTIFAGALLLSAASCIIMTTTSDTPSRPPEEDWPRPAPTVSTDTAYAGALRITEIRKERARYLRDDAYGLQQRGLVREAIAKYRESLFYWPDQRLDSYVMRLENSVMVPLPPTIQRPSAPGTRAALPGEVSAVIRNRSSHDLFLRLSEGAEGRDLMLLPGEIREVTFGTGTSGEVTLFVVQGGRIAVGRKWAWNPSDPSVVPVILYDDNEPEQLMLMTGIKRR